MITAVTWEEGGKHLQAPFNPFNGCLSKLENGKEECLNISGLDQTNEMGKLESKIKISLFRKKVAVTIITFDT